MIGENFIMKKLNIQSSILGFAIIGVLCITSLKAEAANISGLSFGAIGGVVFDSPSLSSSSASLPTSGRAIFAGGLTAEISLAAMFSLEFDMLYIKHKFSQDTAQFFGTNVTSTTSSGSLQFPFILRFRPIPFLNPGFGFYYGRVITNWSVSADNFNSTTVNYGKNDLGLVFALGTSFPIAGLINLVADLRYTRSLNDSGGDTNNSLKFSQIQFFVGLRLDL